MEYGFISAFHDTIYEAQVERLKKRIDANFGPTMDKVADVMFETASMFYVTCF